MKHTSFLRRIVLLAACCSLAGLASAQSAAGPGGYPGTGRVTIVVPFAPGGATDIVARLVADELGKRWGTAVVVDNKAGAGGGIGTEFVARAKPDGYTLLLGTQTALSVNPTLLKKIGYSVDKDFAPVTQLASTPLVLLAGNKSGATDVKSLVAVIKAKPDAVSYGSSGNGTSQHLTALMFLNRIGATAVHVPYKGSSQSLVDLAGGQIDMQFDNMTTALAFAKNNQAKALAVTSAARSPLAPDLPTVAESSVAGFEAATWLGLLAPAATPAPVVNWLNAEVVAVLRSPAVVERLAAQGFTPRPMTPEAFRRFIQDETRKFAEIIKANRVSIE
ncbi:tripartite-type tricarboxylate transporter receptor subunit TctC [Variovorax boronicumulans]|uniref:Bug family tripartite tricarboxylate transporter substrate binding protein n=1 Tax=Variovorax boronicumulans TaxID=436515 RepID=UPI002788D1DE|nr:tripartite tricarboxylate transporter substrate binding protein [Variovorax boronicumulans]MDQ0072540.1 tripartite-type tricarboxylate transporter receptor subunit TctC [Variovorax boronicumulans]